MNNIPEPTAKRQKTIFDFFRAGPSGRDRRDVQVESSASVTEDPDGNPDLAIVNAGHEAPTSPSSNAPEGVSDAGKEPAGAELIEPEQPNPFGNSSADKGLCRYGRCETAHPGDIGRLVSKRENLTNQDRLHALKERWVPANRDEFPTCHHDNDGKSCPRRCTEKTLRLPMAGSRGLHGCNFPQPTRPTAVAPQPWPSTAVENCGQPAGSRPWAIFMKIS